ncbi:MAG: sigma-54-dependent Fis family transcriptional regulator [Candidatus Cloacimonetes bacterium]|nr:sigma-54-dependent Fis family transcriptional regulator [Candidatus Cloacimonadota bacterium]
MKILVIDDEKNICLTLQGILEDEKYQVVCAVSAKEGVKTFDEFEPDILLLDVKLQDANGIEILDGVMKSDHQIPVIMISGNSSISDAVKAIKLGAFDFLEKPLSLPKVKITVKKAVEFRQMSLQMAQLKDQYEKDWNLIGNSRIMQDLQQVINRVAPSNAKILIRGESGTGKELVARAIHGRSPRFNMPFIKFNSAAIPRELVESELFGYEKGAFTGAVKNKRGKLEEADGGTLFLDEIGDMDLAAQAKILRVIQEGEFERVGSNKTHFIDVRIIAATNKNLEELVETGAFREDLFYRLNVVPVISPPLRERKEDIPLLIEHFSLRMASEMKLVKKEFAPNAMAYLQNLSFPGNVRELKNLIERIYILCDHKTITQSELESLSCVSLAGVKTDDSAFWNTTAVFNEKKKEFESRYLSTQLKLHDNSVSKTAEALGLQQSNLSRKLHELEIL